MPKATKSNKTPERGSSRSTRSATPSTTRLPVQSDSQGPNSEQVNKTWHCRQQRSRPNTADGRNDTRACVEFSSHLQEISLEESPPGISPFLPSTNSSRIQFSHETPPASSEWYAGSNAPKRTPSKPSNCPGTSTNKRSTQSKSQSPSYSRDSIGKQKVSRTSKPKLNEDGSASIAEKQPQSRRESSRDVRVDSRRNSKTTNEAIPPIEISRTASKPLKERPVSPFVIYGAEDEALLERKQIDSEPQIRAKPSKELQREIENSKSFFTEFKELQAPSQRTSKCSSPDRIVKKSGGAKVPQLKTQAKSLEPKEEPKIPYIRMTKEKPSGKESAPASTLEAMNQSQERSRTVSTSLIGSSKDVGKSMKASNESEYIPRSTVSLLSYPQKDRWDPKYKLREVIQDQTKKIANDKGKRLEPSRPTSREDITAAKVQQIEDAQSRTYLDLRQSSSFTTRATFTKDKDSHSSFKTVSRTEDSINVMGVSSGSTKELSKIVPSSCDNDVNIQHQVVANVPAGKISSEATIEQIQKGNHPSKTPSNQYHSLLDTRAQRSRHQSQYSVSIAEEGLSQTSSEQILSGESKHHSLLGKEVTDVSISKISRPISDEEISIPGGTMQPLSRHKEHRGEPQPIQDVTNPESIDEMTPLQVSRRHKRTIGEDEVNISSEYGGIRHTRHEYPATTSSGVHQFRHKSKSSSFPTHGSDEQVIQDVTPPTLEDTESSKFDLTASTTLENESSQYSTQEIKNTQHQSTNRSTEEVRTTRSKELKGVHQDTRKTVVATPISEGEVLLTEIIENVPLTAHGNIKQSFHEMTTYISPELQRYEHSKHKVNVIPSESFREQEIKCLTTSISRSRHHSKEITTITSMDVPEIKTATPIVESDIYKSKYEIRSNASPVHSSIKEPKSGSNSKKSSKHDIGAKTEGWRFRRGSRGGKIETDASGKKRSRTRSFFRRKEKSKKTESTVASEIPDLESRYFADNCTLHDSASNVFIEIDQKGSQTKDLRKTNHRSPAPKSTEEKIFQQHSTLSCSELVGGEMTKILGQVILEDSKKCTSCHEIVNAVYSLTRTEYASKTSTQRSGSQQCPVASITQTTYSTEQEEEVPKLNTEMREPPRPDESLCSGQWGSSVRNTPEEKKMEIDQSTLGVKSTTRTTDSSEETTESEDLDTIPERHPKEGPAVPSVNLVSVHSRAGGERVGVVTAAPGPPAPHPLQAPSFHCSCPYNQLTLSDHCVCLSSQEVLPAGAFPPCSQGPASECIFPPSPPNTEPPSVSPHTMTPTPCSIRSPVAVRKTPSTQQRTDKTYVATKDSKVAMEMPTKFATDEVQFVLEVSPRKSSIGNPAIETVPPCHVPTLSVAFAHQTHRGQHPGDFSPSEDPCNAQEAKGATLKPFHAQAAEAPPSVKMNSCECESNPRPVKRSFSYLEETEPVRLPPTIPMAPCMGGAAGACSQPHVPRAHVCGAGLPAGMAATGAITVVTGPCRASALVKRSDAPGSVEGKQISKTAIEVGTPPEKMKSRTLPANKTVTNDVSEDVSSFPVVRTQSMAAVTEEERKAREKEEKRKSRELRKAERKAEKPERKHSKLCAKMSESNHRVSEERQARRKSERKDYKEKRKEEHHREKMERKRSQISAKISRTSHKDLLISKDRKAKSGRSESKEIDKAERKKRKLENKKSKMSTKLSETTYKNIASSADFTEPVNKSSSVDKVASRTLSLLKKQSVAPSLHELSHKILVQQTHSVERNITGRVKEYRHAPGGAISAMLVADTPMVLSPTTSKTFSMGSVTDNTSTTRGERKALIKYERREHKSSDKAEKKREKLRKKMGKLSSHMSQTSVKRVTLDTTSARARSEQGLMQRKEIPTEGKLLVDKKLDVPSLSLTSILSLNPSTNSVASDTSMVRAEEKAAKAQRKEHKKIDKMEKKKQKLENKISKLSSKMSKTSEKISVLEFSLSVATCSHDLQRQERFTRSTPKDVEGLHSPSLSVTSLSSLTPSTCSVATETSSLSRAKSKAQLRLHAKKQKKREKMEKKKMKLENQISKLSAKISKTSDKISSLEFTLAVARSRPSVDPKASPTISTLVIEQNPQIRRSSRDVSKSPIDSATESDKSASCDRSLARKERRARRKARRKERRRLERIAKKLEKIEKERMKSSGPESQNSLEDVVAVPRPHSVQGRVESAETPRKDTLRVIQKSPCRPSGHRNSEYSSDTSEEPNDNSLTSIRSMDIDTAIDRVSRPRTVETVDEGNQNISPESSPYVIGQIQVVDSGSATASRRHSVERNISDGRCSSPHEAVSDTEHQEEPPPEDTVSPQPSRTSSQEHVAPAANQDTDSISPAISSPSPTLQSLLAQSSTNEFPEQSTSEEKGEQTTSVKTEEIHEQVADEETQKPERNISQLSAKVSHTSQKISATATHVDKNNPCKVFTAVSRASSCHLITPECTVPSFAVEVQIPAPHPTPAKIVRSACLMTSNVPLARHTVVHNSIHSIEVKEKPTPEIGGCESKTDEASGSVQSPPPASEKIETSASHVSATQEIATIEENVTTTPIETHMEQATSSKESSVHLSPSKCGDGSPPVGDVSTSAVDHQVAPHAQPQGWCSSKGPPLFVIMALTTPMNPLPLKQTSDVGSGTSPTPLRQIERGGQSGGRCMCPGDCQRLDQSHKDDPHSDVTSFADHDAPPSPPLAPLPEHPRQSDTPTANPLAMAGDTSAPKKIDGGLSGPSEERITTPEGMRRALCGECVWTDSEAEKSREPQVRSADEPGPYGEWSKGPGTDLSESEPFTPHPTPAPIPDISQKTLEEERSASPSVVSGDNEEVPIGKETQTQTQAFSHSSSDEGDPPTQSENEKGPRGEWWQRPGTEEESEPSFPHHKPAPPPDTSEKQEKEQPTAELCCDDDEEMPWMETIDEETQTLSYPHGYDGDTQTQDHPGGEPDLSSHNQSKTSSRCGICQSNSTKPSGISVHKEKQPLPHPPDGESVKVGPRQEQEHRRRESSLSLPGPSAATQTHHGVNEITQKQRADSSRGRTHSDSSVLTRDKSVGSDIPGFQVAPENQPPHSAREDMGLLPGPSAGTQTPHGLDGKTQMRLRSSPCGRKPSDSSVLTRDKSVGSDIPGLKVAPEGVSSPRHSENSEGKPYTRDQSQQRDDCCESSPDEPDDPKQKVFKHKPLGGTKGFTEQRNKNLQQSRTSPIAETSEENQPPHSHREDTSALRKGSKDKSSSPKDPDDERDPQEKRKSEDRDSHLSSERRTSPPIALLKHADGLSPPDSPPHTSRKHKRTSKDSSQSRKSKDDSVEKDSLTAPFEGQKSSKRSSTSSRRQSDDKNSLFPGQKAKRRTSKEEWPSQRPPEIPKSAYPLRRSSLSKRYGVKRTSTDPSPEIPSRDIATRAVRTQIPTSVLNVQHETTPRNISTRKSSVDRSQPDEKENQISLEKPQYERESLYIAQKAKAPINQSQSESTQTTSERKPEARASGKKTTEQKYLNLLSTGRRAEGSKTDITKTADQSSPSKAPIIKDPNEDKDEITRRSQEKKISSNVKTSPAAAEVMDRLRQRGAERVSSTAKAVEEPQLVQTETPAAEVHKNLKAIEEEHDQKKCALAALRGSNDDRTSQPDGSKRSKKHLKSTTENGRTSSKGESRPSREKSTVSQRDSKDRMKQSRDYSKAEMHKGSEVPVEKSVDNKGKTVETKVSRSILKDRTKPQLGSKMNKERVSTAVQSDSVPQEEMGSRNWLQPSAFGTKLRESVKRVSGEKKKSHSSISSLDEDSESIDIDTEIMTIKQNMVRDKDVFLPDDALEKVESIEITGHRDRSNTPRETRESYKESLSELDKKEPKDTSKKDKGVGHSDGDHPQTRTSGRDSKERGVKANIKDKDKHGGSKDMSGILDKNTEKGRKSSTKTLPPEDERSPSFQEKDRKLSRTGKDPDPWARQTAQADAFDRSTKDTLGRESMLIASVQVSGRSRSRSGSASMSTDVTNYSDKETVSRARVAAQAALRRNALLSDENSSKGCRICKLRKQQLKGRSQVSSASSSHSSADQSRTQSPTATSRCPMKMASIKSPTAGKPSYDAKDNSTSVETKSQCIQVSSPEFLKTASVSIQMPTPSASLELRPKKVRDSSTCTNETHTSHNVHASSAKGATHSEATSSEQDSVSDTHSGGDISVAAPPKPPLQPPSRRSSARTPGSSSATTMPSSNRTSPSVRTSTRSDYTSSGSSTPQSSPHHHEKRSRHHTTDAALQTSKQSIEGIEKTPSEKLDLEGPAKFLLRWQATAEERATTWPSPQPSLPRCPEKFHSGLLTTTSSPSDGTSDANSTANKQRSHQERHRPGTLQPPMARHRFRDIGEFFSSMVTPLPWDVRPPRPTHTRSSMVPPPPTHVSSTSTTQQPTTEQQQLADIYWGQPGVTSLASACGHCNAKAYAGSSIPLRSCERAASAARHPLTPSLTDSLRPALRKPLPTGRRPSQQPFAATSGTSSSTSLLSANAEGASRPPLLAEEAEGAQSRSPTRGQTDAGSIPGPSTPCSKRGCRNDIQYYSANLTWDDVRSALTDTNHWLYPFADVTAIAMLKGAEAAAAVVAAATSNASQRLDSLIPHVTASSPAVTVTCSKLFDDAETNRVPWLGMNDPIPVNFRSEYFSEESVKSTPSRNESQTSVGKENKPKFQQVLSTVPTESETDEKSTPFTKGQNLDTWSNAVTDEDVTRCPSQQPPSPFPEASKTRSFICTCGTSRSNATAAFYSDEEFECI